ncbi:MAG: aminotransferase class I/II-fold pyridoxal phosphate-dependent enzyme [Cyclobacteriaceae bacterium]|nr:aminotransferase class I/II-fold pyridoxal phosphate-dependent enzyme [Cyclobacteriaceae bacterium]
MELSSRLPDVGTTIFTVMSKMATEHNAINLSQGFPDFPLDDTLIRLVYSHMQAGHNQYAPMPGLPELRQAIARMVHRTTQMRVDPELQVTVTGGGTEALYCAITALVHPGDEVILFDPSYDSYSPSIRLAGGIPVPVSLHPPDFSIDWTEVSARITRRTRAIIINSPHNPTGSVLKESDLQALERLATQHDLLVISDEVYDRIIFDGRTHQSVLRFPVLAERSVAVYSFGKMFHATGWKVGFTVAPTAITTEIRRAHQFITFSVNTPVQWALADYLAEPTHYENLASFYEQKRNLFLEQLKGSPFVPLPCHGTYFQVCHYEGDRSDLDMAKHLTIEHRLASIPVSVFYHNRQDRHLLRFCFAKKESTLQAAGEILRSL